MCVCERQLKNKSVTNSAFLTFKKWDQKEDKVEKVLLES
jgi:hypothetical protein